MGKVFDNFESLTYENEAEVNQNFVIPILTKFLGFDRSEIKPEWNFPAFDITYGHKVISSKDLPKHLRPDFVVCVENTNNPKFIVETKAITEKLENHTPQAISYAIGVKVNFIVLTNGKEFQIFNVNDQMLKAKTIGELDLKFDVVQSILSRNIHITKKPIEIIQSFDYSRALNQTPEEKVEEEIKKKELRISDFKEYIINIRDNFKIWQKPHIFQCDPEFNIEHFSPNKMLKFEPYVPYQSEFNHLSNNEKYILSDLEDKLKSQTIIIIGESGIGKTTALKYLTWLQSTECIDLKNTQIPIYIQLRYYGLNNSIEDLAIQFLAEYGFSITNSEYREYLNKNEFVFLLDALDEIPEQYIEDFQDEFEHFTENYSHQIILTTRKLRIPKYQRSIYLSILPLDHSTIEKFLKTYLKGQWQDLYNQIKWNYLEKESQNTLILTFIIWIYRKKYRLPQSRPQIIKIIVENIQEWENSKRSRFSSDLPWTVKEHLLSALAFESAKSGKITFKSDELFEIFDPILEEYIDRKEIRPSYLRTDIINNLKSTGIIEDSNNEISFWHRAFLEYFASIELAKQYESYPDILHEYFEKISWRNILLGTSGILINSTDFISEIKKNNIYLAALCIYESKNVDLSLIEEIRSELSIFCDSPIIERRQRGIFLLSKIEQKYPSDIIYKILDGNKYPDVRQRALETIARTRTQRAKDKVNELAKWDEHSQHLITGETVPGSVAKALSNFDEEEHLKILEIWDSHPDVFTRGACASALLDVIRERRLSDNVKKAIVDFYYDNLKKNDHTNDAYGISDLFIEINDEKIVFDLIEEIPILEKEKRISSLTRFSEILAGCPSKEVLNKLISIVSDSTKHQFLREYCANALSTTNEQVPIDVYTEMIKDSNPIIRRSAVLGFDKFTSHQIKELLIENINDEHPNVQSFIIEILAERGFLTELIEEQHLPEKLYDSSIKIILKEIRKYGLKELIPFITKLKQNISDERLLIDISSTYCILEDFETSKQIIESFCVDEKFFFEGYGLSDLIEIAPNFEPVYALDIINRAWNSIDKSENKGYFYEHLCIDAIAKIKSEDAISFLKEKAIFYVENKSIVIIEYIFRNLNRIASEDDEEWYIQYVEKYAPFDNSDYHRIIEGLGMIGTEKSEPLINKIAKEYKENEYILNICYFSLEMIKLKSGNFYTVSEDDLLSS